MGHAAQSRAELAGGSAALLQLVATVARSSSSFNCHIVSEVINLSSTDQLSHDHHQLLSDSRPGRCELAQTRHDALLDSSRPPGLRGRGIQRLVALPAVLESKVCGPHPSALPNDALLIDIPLPDSQISPRTLPSSSPPPPSSLQPTPSSLPAQRETTSCSRTPTHTPRTCATRPQARAWRRTCAAAHFPARTGRRPPRRSASPRSWGPRSRGRICRP